jgi:hypothetical protein
MECFCHYLYCEIVKLDTGLHKMDISIGFFLMSLKCGVGSAAASEESCTRRQHLLQYAGGVPIRVGEARRDQCAGIDNSLEV